MIKPQTLKGFRDFLPQEARKRQYVINTLKSVFELHGYEPLETPTLEYEDILAGKYGEEGDKLMYRFEDLGKRKVAMRYDQTVPLARVVAQYQNELPMPFKRYQIQPVWRADNTQKGRFREFLQCDADIIGSSSSLADAEIVIVASKALEQLGFNKYKVLFNSRNLLFNKITQAGITKNKTTQTIRIIDKIKKIGWDSIIQELIKIGIDEKSASALKNLLTQSQPQEDTQMTEIWNLLVARLGTSNIQWDLTLARGLEYYTSLIFELEIEGYTAGSVCGGGRYDNLIGMFTKEQIPAVGFAFGFDRLIEAMEQLNLFPSKLTGSSTQILVTIFSQELKNKSLEIAQELRNNNIKTEIYLGEIKEKNPLERQLKYADQKGIQNVIIIGPEETEKNRITLKNLKTREQKQYTLEELLKILG